MKVFCFAIILLCFSSAIEACPPLDLPLFASMNCSWTANGDKQCRFKCDADANMIGEPEVLCRAEEREWSNPIPLCSPRCKLNKKNKAVCPKINSDFVRRATEHQGSLTSKQQDTIRKIKQAYRTRKIRRSSQLCYPWMCDIDCALLGPSRHLIMRCYRCSVQKLKCDSRSGSLFG